MSIAEFYIDNGIDPSDPDSMDAFLEGLRSRQEFEFTGVAIDNFTSPESAYPLNESELDYMAETRGWTKLDTSRSTAPMASYKRGDVRLNFWLSTGTVGSYLEHPRQGKTQLFRRSVDMSEASSIFNNPRQHTGRGYQHHRPNPLCRYGRNCHRSDCRFEHPSDGGGRGPCHYGNQCSRPGCWFDHPDGH